MLSWTCYPRITLWQVLASDYPYNVWCRELDTSLLSHNMIIPYLMYFHMSDNDVFSYKVLCTLLLHGRNLHAFYWITMWASVIWKVLGGLCQPDETLCLWWLCSDHCRNKIAHIFCGTSDKTNPHLFRAVRSRKLYICMYFTIYFSILFIVYIYICVITEQPRQ